MTDLTEQWKKGELKQCEYWCKITESPYIERVYLPCCDDIIVEVLAPVPSYNEYEQLKGYNEYLRNIIMECEPYIENVCTALNMEKFVNGGFLHKSNEVLSKIRIVIGEKKR